MYFHSSDEAQDELTDLRSQVEAQIKADMVEQEDGREKEQITYAENGMMSKYYPLYERNNDMVGWIRVKGTNIDYPVMYKNSDNSFYMNHDFDKQKQSSGLPFVDYECDMNRSSNIIVYGHNMKNGTMFAELMKYKDKEFYDAHGDIDFDNMYTAGKYRVVAAFYIKHNSDFRYYEFTNAADEEEFNEYMAQVKKHALYDTGETVRYGDKLLTLSTCSYNSSDERFVVVAKKKLY